MIPIYITANFAWNCASFCLKFRFELSSRTNNRSKVHSILLHTANYCTKVHADWNNRHRENATKYHKLSKRFLFKWNFLEKSRKARISPKFVCITFSQYCSDSGNDNNGLFTKHPQSSSSFVKTYIQYNLKLHYNYNSRNWKWNHPQNFRGRGEV